MFELSLFTFNGDLSRMSIPESLNNPFAESIPDIAKLAAHELQDFIALESKYWKYDIHLSEGKMFGVLVIEMPDRSYRYLAASSGKLPGNAMSNKFVPSVFDDSTDDFFINNGMRALTEIGKEIKNSTDPLRIETLRAKRRLKSLALQKRLFENTRFTNISGIQKNVLEIFTDSSQGNPPSAAGECAAPKLLKFAFEKQLRPIALAEFWWGKNPNNQGRSHKLCYPACKNKCRPILEFMLSDDGLYERAVGK